MDPQQRGLLETAYLALENAGITLDQVSGSKTSVFTGCFTDDYKMMYASDPEQSSLYGMTGVSSSLLANRISWFFNLTGSSANIDTACSSSLMALDIACQNLHGGESNMSLVAGCNLILSPATMLLLDNQNLLSKHGRSYSFDKRADGYARGEGFSVLVLKRLSDAMRDGDTIRAVIRSTHSNQNGHTTAGITRTSRTAQENLIRETYEKAGLSMEPTKYVEAHGTGTRLGDAFEANAIGDTFRKGRKSKEPLYIGAVKSNIGHLEGGSGLAGLIKAILVLEHAIIPPNVNYDAPNPRIDTQMLNIKFPVLPVPWPNTGLRRASISGMGFGGSNVHVILDDAYHFLLDHKMTGNHNTVIHPPTVEEMNSESEKPSSCRKFNVSEHRIHCTPKLNPRLLVWSASDKNSLQRSIASCLQHCQALDSKLGATETEDYLCDLAYTLFNRRSSFSWKAFLAVESLKDLSQLEMTPSAALSMSAPPRIGLVFTGQGAQWFEMGQELKTYPVFYDSLVKSAKVLHDLGCEWDLLYELYEAPNPSVNLPEYSQPLCTAVQIALVDLISSFNIVASTVVGHSSGEIAAAYCIGALSQSSAMKIAYFRGTQAKILAEENAPRGAMIAVKLAPGDAQVYMDKVAVIHGSLDITIACYNSQNNITISGDRSQIDTLHSILAEANQQSHILKVDVAYHSSQMVKISESYRLLIQELEKGPSQRQHISMVSSVTGEKVNPEDLCQSDYWVRNLVSPVKFDKAMAMICNPSFRSKRRKIDNSHERALFVDILVEVGPHAALRGPINDTIQQLSSSQTYISLLLRNISAIRTVLDVAGRLHCAGYPVNLNQVNQLSLRKSKVLSDLPGYSFDHSQKYWYESRVSKGIRFGAHAKNRLLGKPVADWNPLDARWRNFIKASDLPWIEDHKVQGTILYPAAGMIVMALEAARQLADQEKQISAFRVEQVKFDAPLVIRSTATEVQVSLRPKLAQTMDAYSQGTSSFDFVIYSYQDEKWVQNANGEVNVICKDQYASTRIGSSTISDASNQSQMDTTNFYRTLRASGYEYGPSFQVVKRASQSINGATGEVQVFRESAEAHVVHPTTLDGILHLIFASHTDGGRRTMDTLLPVQLKSLWISSSALGHDLDVSPRFDVAYVSARKLETSYLGSETDISVFTESGGTLLARIEGFKLQKMTTTTISVDSSALATIPPRLCRKLEWRPDLSFLDADEIFTMCGGRKEGYEEPTEFFHSLDRLINLFLKRAMLKMNTSGYDIAQLPPHIQRYVEWIKRAVQTDETNVGEDANIEPLSKIVGEANDYGKLLVIVGNNLFELITGQVDRLSFFFQSDPDLLPAAYISLNQISNFMQPLHNYLDNIAHLDPSMQVLEVGAGTGGTTTSVLDALTSRSGDPRYGQYDFTDLSPAFFETAREKFRNFRRVNYKVFDAEQDPTEQGYALHSYDLVIASNVLHATRSLANTLQQVRSLLKPGGKLILMEMIRPDIPRFGFAFGLLEGWWLGINDSREWSPCISEERWNEVLTENGFSGNDLIFPDFKDENCRQMSVIVSTAISSTPSERSDEDLDLVLLVSDESDISSQSTMNIKSGLEYLGTTIKEIVTLQQATGTRHAPGRTIYITLFDLKRPFLRAMSADGFTNLQSLLQLAKGILWVSGVASMPECGMVDGLARVIRGESNKLVLVTASLEADDGILSQRQINHLQRIVQRTPWDTLNSDYETAFVESHGTIEVGRIEDDEDLSQQIIDYSRHKNPTAQTWAQNSCLKIQVECPGLLDTLYFAESDVNTEPLAVDEIEVSVKASGIIFRDVLTALGKLDGGYMGLECAGEVTRVGANCDFYVGQRVCGLAPSSSSSYVHMNRHCVMAIPPGMSFTEAASLPVAFYTAYCTLESARIRKGESILIHSAAGATGQAAIQLSCYFGISEIYATVGTDEKKQLLRDHYAIPETHIFSSRDTDFAEHIKRCTKGGVDIVLNSLSGKGLLASWECLAAYGRFLEIGKSDIIANNSLPMQQFLRNVSFSAFDLSTLVTERPERLADATRALESLWIEKKLRLITPLHVYPVSEAEAALRLLQSGKSSGKIVLEMLPDSLVKVISNRKPKELFRADRTYVVVGGLGGLGRSIARWMVTQGAKYLLLPSRSGPNTDKAVELVEDLVAKGVTVRVPVCDVADPASIKSVLVDCATNMPPIAGCIQAAMVLRDSLFEKMSFEDWKTAINPKVDGSWNLHKLLPPQLDFFIMLSSNCGILGQVGQANYAAGNTYQDALARHRVSQGEHGISIDLGAMMLEGYVSENEEVSKRLLESGYFHPLTQDNLFALLEHCCDPAVRLTPADSQIIFGLARPTAMSTEEILHESRLASPLFRSMHIQDFISDAQAPESSAPEVNNSKQQFISAPTIAEAGAIVTAELVKKLSRNLPSMSAGKVDVWQPLMAYGVDSLLSVELRSWFAREFAADVGIFETMNGATFSSIGVTVARNSRWRTTQKGE
ncbi:hypothetical protein ACMFMG_010772 [Clarireedia jacksonii]